MSQPLPPAQSISPARTKPQFQVRHLCLLTAFVAIAIVNIQDQRRSEAALIALAVSGFVLYAILCWGLWKVALRFKDRVGTVPLFGLYALAMSALFLIATIAYLFIEHAYLFGF